jgi:dTMP kinase
LTLLWSPAKDASVPHLIGQQHLATANSLSLVAAYGTFPVGAFVFAGLARFATFLNNHYTFSFGVDKEFLALWADGATFFISAICIFSLSAVFKSIRRAQKEKEKLHAAELGEKSQADVTKGFREIKEGYSFIGQHRLVRGVMIGLGVGIVGGGALVPLGSVYAVQVLHGGSAAFSLLMGCLGTGASIGLITLLFIQKYLKRGTVFWSAIVMCGAAIVLTGLSSSLWLSGLGTGLVGAFAGSAYVTGFTLLQEEVHDDVRGRTFAALYAIIRVCMLFALAVTPLFANIFQWVIKKMNDGSTLFNIGSWRYDVPGVRVTLIVGGVIALAAGFLSRSQIVHPDKKSSRDPEPKEAKPKSQKKVSQEQESQHVARVKEATT